MTGPNSPKELAKEVAAQQFRDRRLNGRLEHIVEVMATEPSASFPKAFDGAGQEAAYRFFSNVAVNAEAILGPHILATRARAATQATVLAVHDITDVDYRRDGRREGFGDGAKQGFHAHLSLALSADGTRTPLGVVGLRTWIKGANEREEAPAASETPNESIKKKRKPAKKKLVTGAENAPTAEELLLQEEALQKSSWLQQIERAESALGGVTKVIHIADRGADDYALHYKLNSTHRAYVIRAKDRYVMKDDNVREKLSSMMAKVDHISERETWINRRRRESSEHRRKIHPEREPRDVTLHISAAKVALLAPAGYGGTQKPFFAHLPKTLDVHVVRVWEPDPPNDAEPIEWLLITNEPIDTPADVCAIVDHYRARWTIEEFFKALKTGCSFERRQLLDYESLCNALAVFAPIAYQMLLLRTFARTAPEAPASRVLTSTEIEVLRTMGRRPLSLQPTVRDVLLAIAALGGHSKYAPDPGWLTIARGYEKLEAYTAGWLAAKSASTGLQPECDQR